MRPVLLRPPDFFSGSIRAFSGRVFDTSSNDETDIHRVPGVTGLNFRSAMIPFFRYRYYTFWKNSILSPSFKRTIAFFHRDVRPSKRPRRVNCDLLLPLCFNVLTLRTVTLNFFSTALAISILL